MVAQEGFALGFDCEILVHGGVEGDRGAQDAGQD